jgi:hypothetical protein
MIEDDGLLSKRRNTRLSSRTDDYDPDKLSLKLVKNQINHLDFRPEIFKPEIVRHVQKIIKESRTPLITRGPTGGSIEVGELSLEESPSPKNTATKFAAPI